MDERFIARLNREEADIIDELGSKPLEELASSLEPSLPFIGASEIARTVPVFHRISVDPILIDAFSDPDTRLTVTARALIDSMWKSTTTFYESHGYADLLRLEERLKNRHSEALERTVWDEGQVRFRRQVARLRRELQGNTEAKIVLLTPGSSRTVTPPVQPVLKMLWFPYQPWGAVEPEIEELTVVSERQWEVFTEHRGPHLNRFLEETGLTMPDVIHSYDTWIQQQLRTIRDGIEGGHIIEDPTDEETLELRRWALYQLRQRVVQAAVEEVELYGAIASRANVIVEVATDVPERRLDLLKTTGNYVAAEVAALMKERRGDMLTIEEAYDILSAEVAQADSEARLYYRTYGNFYDALRKTHMNGVTDRAKSMREQGRDAIYNSS